MMIRAIQKAQEFLLRAQNGDGGWPYSPGAQSYPEPTCYGLMTLGVGGGHGSAAGARVEGIHWLEERITGDGAFVLDGDSDFNWSTSLAVFTLTRLGASADVRERSSRWLLNLKGEHMEATDEVPFDSDLAGWPWIDETFSWVEPTSYALLALKAAGYAEHPRVIEAERLLLDRSCAGGGWNYGNREVLGRELPPFVPTTAWAAMALQDVPGAAAPVTKGLDFLQAETAAHPSVMALSLAILAFDVYGRPLGDFAGELESRQDPGGGWHDSVHLTALAALALHGAQGEGNVFRL